MCSNHPALGWSKRLRDVVQTGCPSEVGFTRLPDPLWKTCGKISDRMWWKQWVQPVADQQEVLNWYPSDTFLVWLFPNRCHIICVAAWRWCQLSNSTFYRKVSIRNRGSVWQSNLQYDVVWCQEPWCGALQPCKCSIRCAGHHEIVIRFMFKDNLLWRTSRKKHHQE